MDQKGYELISDVVNTVYPAGAIVEPPDEQNPDRHFFTSIMFIRAQSKLYSML